MNNRYHRQMLFQPIGEEGQRRLQESHVAIVGVGALGSSNAEMLARAGVGTLTLLDRDYVEASNLQRQQLFSEADVEAKTPKVIAAKKRLEEINHSTIIHAKVIDAGVEELENIVPQVDVVIDATDNFDTRLILNDVCQKHHKPWIYGACVSSYGVTFTVLPENSPCLHCLMDHIPNDGATCDTVGIISPAVQMVVSHQVTETLKIVTGNTDALSGKLIAFDLWKNQHIEVKVASLKDNQCPSCAKKQYPYLTYQSQLKTAVLCGRNTVQIRSSEQKVISFDELKNNLERNKRVKLFSNPYLLSFEIEKFRIVLFRDGRTLIHGTKDITEAKKVYYQYIG
ncbi:MoeB/ThiF family adenylyltransferase [Gracilibacillus sp. S3-1-1]|uniref:MoeB/ThiF family adenylyltransferase n=1 Tax=Gracilibacillus pellucidus TaxID=3095368 RepID=A0ACC6M428_9BACI|nr:MoeB/ThiF family adenylyltransferase [Gracilibacillus sp. S3-1-1]MDX8045726.1 MoeB/ThiF family adenylyltransferase [Gracilibacillus sp. S3-1-1]